MPLINQTCRIAPDLTPGRNPRLDDVMFFSILRAKDLDQLYIKPRCLHSSPGKENQHEVMKEGSTKPTQQRNTSHMTSEQEENVETS